MRKPKAKLKTANMSLRMEPRVKDMAERAAHDAHRSVSNFIEFLVLAYGKQNGYEPDSQLSRSGENETEKAK